MDGCFKKIVIVDAPTGSALHTSASSFDWPSLRLSLRLKKRQMCEEVHS
jgi:hypothetical protein